MREIQHDSEPLTFLHQLRPKVVRPVEGEPLAAKIPPAAAAFSSRG
jgi:hypothetical protein